jgi:murein DD-endopeptidase MepM/ murein hydrolase activator NlpD
MRRGNGARRGTAALRVLSVVLLVSSCAPRAEGPAPVVSGETAERAPLSIAIERGQTLSGIAQSYHMPMRVIAEANGLFPPYSIQAGRTLIIPGAGPPRAPAPPTSVAALPPTRNEYPPAAASSEPPGGPAAPETPPVEHPAAVSPESATVAAAPLPPPAAATAPPATAPSGETPAPAQAPAAAAPSRPPAPSWAAPPTRSNSAFLWPVRGHVVASFGSRSDGTHNDGINIAAPKGTAVQAVDAGVVAYSGNELRGYGNLILLKHPNGWISAYAHCDQLLVRRGQKVARGEVIARVGSTGSVSEPQLHFELRRGNHPVDPREFLAPLPTAATKDSRSG